MRRWTGLVVGHREMRKRTMALRRKENKGNEIEKRSKQRVSEDGGNRRLEREEIET